jgi:hypothetical protein
LPDQRPAFTGHHERVLIAGRPGWHDKEDTMTRITRIAPALVALAATLALVPTALASQVTPDNRAQRPAPNAFIVPRALVLPDNRADRVGPAAMPVASTVVVRASRAAGFAWGDAAIGAAAMLGLTLAAGGAAGLRGRRRELAA